MRKAGAFALSFAVAASLMYAFFGWNHLLPDWARLAAIVLLPFGAGYAQGWIMGHQHYRSIAYGGFLALLLLWTPVIVVTYGFALMFVPVLAALAACIGWAASLAKPFTAP